MMATRYHCLSVHVFRKQRRWGWSVASYTESVAHGDAPTRDEARRTANRAKMQLTPQMAQSGSKHYDG